MFTCDQLKTDLKSELLTNLSILQYFAVKYDCLSLYGMSDIHHLVSQNNFIEMILPYFPLSKNVIGINTVTCITITKFLYQNLNIIVYWTHCVFFLCFYILVIFSYLHILVQTIFVFVTVLNTLVYYYRFNIDGQ